MAQVITKYGVGRVCSSNDPTEIKESIKTMLRAQVTPEQFEILRRDLMGDDQVQKLRRALTEER